MSSRGVNKVILIGNVGNEPDVRYMPSGDPVANLSIATSETWRDKNTGEQQERTEWHRVVFIGKLADIVRQYVHKGSKLYVEGQLRTRKWQAQDGQDRYTTEIVVSVGGTMQMLDSRQSGDTRLDGDVPRAEPAGPPASRPAPAASAAPKPGDPPSFDDDIPF